MAGLVCVRLFGKLREAQIAKGLLIANGIEADIFYDTGVYHPEGFTGIELKVRQEDKEAALKLLNKR